MLPYKDFKKKTDLVSLKTSKEWNNVLITYKKYYDSNFKPGMKILLINALENWQKTKNQGWKNSRRNKNLHLVENLYNELTFNPKKLTQKDRQALNLIYKQYEENAQELFKGKQLRWKKKYILTDSKKAHQKWNEWTKKEPEKLINAIKGVPEKNLLDSVNELLTSLFDGLTIKDVTEALGVEFVNDLTKNIIPYFGAISSGTTTIKEVIEIVKSAHEKKQINSAAKSFAPGDPYAAFKAILEIQKREIELHTTNASINFTSAIVQTITTAFDLGLVTSVVTGSAKSFANLIHEIFHFARGWIEMNKANKILKPNENKINIKLLFETCPLLGCYLIHCSTTSSVVALTLKEFGTTDFLLQTERLKKEAEPVFKKAKKVIDDSRYIINPDMPKIKKADDDVMHHALDLLKSGEFSKNLHHSWESMKFHIKHKLYVK